MSTPRLPVRISGEDFDLLDGPSAAKLFCNLVPEASGGSPFEDVRVERCWPVGALEPLGFVLEWSFRCKNRRQAMYGQWGIRRKTKQDNSGKAPCQSVTRQDRVTLTSDGLRGLRKEIEECGLILRSPDQDDHLPQLATCLNGSQMIRRLRAFGVDTDSCTSLRCRLGGYRPNRRATVRFNGADFSTMLSGKTFRDQRGKDLIHRHLLVSEELRGRCGGMLRVPAPIGFDDELNMAFFVWMPGIRAEQARYGNSALIDAAIQSLAIIHQLPWKGRDTFMAADELAIVRRWRHSIQFLLPEEDETAQLLVEALVHASSDVRQDEVVTIHRDFYEKQLILSPDSITVLDLDTLAAGDPAVDLGNFLSHVFLRDLGLGGNVASIACTMQRFLDGYQQHRGPIDRRNLCFYTASSLFRLGAVHALRTTSARHREVLWQAASRLLANGQFDTSVFLEAATAGSCDVEQTKVSIK